MDLIPVSHFNILIVQRFKLLTALLTSGLIPPLFLLELLEKMREELMQE